MICSLRAGRCRRSWRKLARLGAQLLMQAALEAEVTEFLGRERYARAAVAEDARPGSRNGYRDATVKTTAGPVTLARPKLRGTAEAFASRLFGSHVTNKRASDLGHEWFAGFGVVVAPGLSGFSSDSPAHVVDHGPVDHGSGTLWECLVIPD